MNKKTSTWMEVAARDLEAAKTLLDDYLANVVLFHSQQCIEKCMKGLLERKNQKVPKIHSVIRLYELLKKDAGVSLPVTDDELDVIDDVYIDTRYPGDFGLLPSGFPSKSDAEKIFLIAETIFTATAKILKITVNERKQS